MQLASSILVFYQFHEIKRWKSEYKAEIEHGQKCRSAIGNSWGMEVSLRSLRKATFSFHYKIRFFLITKEALEQLHLNINHIWNLKYAIKALWE